MREQICEETNVIALGTELWWQSSAEQLRSEALKNNWVPVISSVAWSKLLKLSVPHLFIHEQRPSWKLPHTGLIWGHELIYIYAPAEWILKHSKSLVTVSYYCIHNSSNLSALICNREVPQRMSMLLKWEHRSVASWSLFSGKLLFW